MAVVRVKRRLQDDPVEVLFLTCKKLKTEENPQTTVFKFAATVNNQEDDVSPHIKEAMGINSQAHGKLNTVEDIVNKVRTENRSASRSNRLKVVNCFRSIGKESGDDVEGSKLTVVDMEDLEEGRLQSQPPNSSASPQDEKGNSTSEEYVYDLYYTADFNDILMERILSGHDVEFFFENRNEEGEANDEANDDEDDSNDENNWRNDYPDEDEFRSSNSEDQDENDEDCIVSRMKKFTLDQNNSDLSSDDEEDLLYGEDARDVFDYSNESRRLAIYNSGDSDENDEFDHSQNSSSE